MLVLLPPSEGKRVPRRGRPLELGSLSFPALEQHRAAVLGALVDLCTTAPPASAARVLGLGPSQAAEVTADAGLLQAPTARADAVYRGVLYEALDLPSLDASARRRATSWLAVTSGLFGLLRPADRIPAYRLSGSVSLPGIGPLSTYWARRLDDSVRQAAGRGLVLDLRSSAYASFWRPGPDLARRVVSMRVLHEAAGVRSVVSHFNKATKGRLVRTLLQDGGAPGSAPRLADHLRSLGWHVEDSTAGEQRRRLDVVVSELAAPAPSNER
ncbi:MAG TPA: peroxide stress protein YaaA [Nocardioidaceae bacterium]|nr:peroxide stress protein YaaA [Nocardioidaceae bacterium]